MVTSEDFKARGNAAFSSGNFSEAIHLFTSALEFDSTNHVLYSNRSACYASISDFQRGLVDAKRCVEISPQWPKGYSRLGSCYYGLREWVLCASAYSKGLQLDQGSETMKKGLEEARAKIREHRKQSTSEKVHRGTGSGDPPAPRRPSPDEKKEGKKRSDPTSKRPRARNKKHRSEDQYDEDFINDDSSADEGEKIEEEEEEELVVDEEGDEEEEEEEEEAVKAAMERDKGDSDEEVDEEEDHVFYRKR
jgi:tetratricopeptide (TPR) repeat protein